MLNETALQIDLHRNGQVEVLEVQADRALVGSGAHCDVRLAPDESAVEQLILEAKDEAVVVKVCSFEPPCRLNGAPFFEGKVSPDALIEFGPVALRVRLTEITQRAQPAKKAASHTHPLVQALALVGLAVGFYYALEAPPAAESALRSAATPPELFAQTKPVCPHDDAEAARSLAIQDALDAENKRERSPFYARDGLSAVPLYERAAACFERVGLQEAADDARDSARALKRRMSDELHVRHVRIERLIAQEKFDALRHEVRLAAEFVQDKSSHPYAHWLSALARESEVRTNLQDKR